MIPNFDDTQFHTTNKAQADEWASAAIADKPKFDFKAQNMPPERYNGLAGVRVPHRLPYREGDPEVQVFSLMLPDGNAEGSK